MGVDWSKLQSVTGVLADAALLAGAAAAVIKFRLFNLLGHRWQSSLVCAHHVLPDGSIVFTADYMVSNTGQRPLMLRAVSMRLVNGKTEGTLLLPDENAEIASRVIRPGDRGQRGNLQVEPGERTIFTLRVRVAELPDCVFVMCALDPVTRRPYTTYRGFYCRFPPQSSGSSGRDGQLSGAPAGTASSIPR